MKAINIAWGGNIKVEVVFENEIPQNIITGKDIVVQFDDIKEQYYAGDYCYFTAKKDSRSSLDEYIERGLLQENTGKSIVVVLSVENKTAILEIHYFFACVQLNATPMKIKLQNGLKNIPAAFANDPIAFIKKEFIFIDSKGKNNIFAIGVDEHDSQKHSKSFTVISNKYRLVIAKNNDELFAVNLTRQTREINSPVAVITGEVSFVEFIESAAYSKAVDDCISSVNAADDYVKLWNGYDELEKIAVVDKASDYGVTEYKSYEVETKQNIIYKFKLKGNSFTGTLNENVELDCTEGADVLKLRDWNGNINDIANIMKFGSYVGTFYKIEGNILYLIDRRAESAKNFPKKGYLFKSIQGDSFRFRRREAAKDAILKGETPMKELIMLINSGVSTLRFDNRTPITSKLAKSFKVPLNDAQKQAVKVAINAPDIALIQGPPGTGKTTVIKAIIQRFEEIFLKENDGNLPKILVTSFQHEAVENAIDGIDFTGIPAKRVGSKRGKEDVQSNIINDWVNEKKAKFEEFIAENGNPNLFGSYYGLKNEMFSWTSKGSNVFEGIALVKRYYDENKLDFSMQFVDEIDKFLASSQNSEKPSGLLLINQKDNADKLKLYSKQRLSFTAFSDDGIKNLKDLIFDFEICNEEIPVFLNKVLETKGKDKDSFALFTDFVKEKIAEFSPITASDEMISRVGTEKILACMLGELENLLMHNPDNLGEAKSKILAEFKLALDTGEGERIVNEYSHIRASTCQQAMDIGRFASNEDFDLVIVDEAARANPLDLFIPMSMAKKIVLVGDQRQLPHMLDDAVIKQIEGDTQKADDYKISFFERCFKMFEEKEDMLSQRTCKLTEQYRMLPDISNFVSSKIYEPYSLMLTCGLTEETIKVRYLNFPQYKGKSLVWVDASMQKFGKEDGIQSKSRECEANIIFEHLREILINPNVKTVGIITYYSKQKELLETLKSTLDVEDKKKVEIGTVDGFQGKEFDVVFLSCVRSNEKTEENLRKNIGFLSDENRLCVSLSRGKNLLILVGDSETVKNVDILNAYIEECKTGSGCYLDA